MQVKIALAVIFAASVALSSSVASAVTIEVGLSIFGIVRCDY